MEQVHHHHSNGRFRQQQEQQTSFDPNSDAYRRRTDDAAATDDDKAFIRDNVYQMVAEPRGQVLIVNNANHAEAQQQNGAGTYREDGERLMSTFKSLGFAVYKRDQFHDLSRRRMEKLLRKFANSKLHKYADACVVVFLTHGNFRDGVYAADGWKIAFEDIVKLFGESEVLYRKPKIFIFDGMHGGGYPDRGVSPPAVAHDDVRGYRVESRQRVDTGIHSPSTLHTNNEDSIHSSPSTGIRNTARNSNSTDGGEVHYITHSRGNASSENRHQAPLAAGADMVFIYNCMHPYRAVHTQDARFIHVLCDTIDENAPKHDLLAILTIVNRRLGSQPSSYMNEFQQSCFTSSLHKLLYFNRGYFENTPMLSDDSDISIGTASHSMSPRLGRRDPFAVALSTTSSSLSSAPQPLIPSRPKKNQQSTDRELYATNAPVEQPREDLYEEQTEEYVETDEGKPRIQQPAPVAVATITTTTREVVVEQVVQRPAIPAGEVAQQQVATTYNDDAARPASSLRGKLTSRLAQSVHSLSSGDTSTSTDSIVAGDDDGGLDVGGSANTDRNKTKGVAGRTKSLEMALGDEKTRYNQPDTVDNNQQQLRQTLPTTTVYNTQTMTNTTANPNIVRQRRRSDDGGRTSSPLVASNNNPQQKKKKKRSFMSKLRRSLGFGKKDKQPYAEAASSAATSATLPARPMTPVATTSSYQHGQTLPATHVAVQEHTETATTTSQNPAADEEYPMWIHSSPQPARRSNRSLGRDVQSQSPQQVTTAQQMTSTTSTTTEAGPTPVMTTPPASATNPFQRNLSQIETHYDQKYSREVRRDDDEKPFRRVVLDQQNPNIVTVFPTSVNSQNQPNEDEVFTTRTPHNSGLYADKPEQKKEVTIENYSVTNVVTELPDHERQPIVVPKTPADTFEAKNEKFVVKTGAYSPPLVSGREIVIENDTSLRTTQLSPDVEVQEQKLYDERKTPTADAVRGRGSSGDSGRRTPLDRQVEKRVETFPLASPLPVKPSPLHEQEFFGRQPAPVTSYEYEENTVVEENPPLYAPAVPGYVQQSTSSSVSTDSPKSPRGEKPAVPAKTEGLVGKLKGTLGFSSDNQSGNRTPTTPTSSPAFGASTNDNVVINVINEPNQELLYQPVVDEARAEMRATSPTRPHHSPPPPPPHSAVPLWFGHDPAPRSPDTTADVRKVTETTTTTTQVVASPTQPAVRAQPLYNDEIFAERDDGLYAPAQDDDVDVRAASARDIEIERTSTSSKEVKKSKSPVSWLTDKLQPANNDELQVRTVTAAQVPVLQSSSNIRAQTEEAYTSESVEGRTTPTGFVAYGTARRRRDSDDSSTTSNDANEKLSAKPTTAEKIKDFFTGGSSAKNDENMTRESGDTDSRPYIRPVLEPIIATDNKQMTVSSTQLIPIERQRQQRDDYDRVVTVTERQLSSPVNMSTADSNRPRIEPVLTVGQSPLRTAENVEQHTVVSPADEQLYKVKEIETENQPLRSGTPTRQFSRGVNEVDDDSQSPRTATSSSGAMSKLKEAFFGNRSPSQANNNTAEDIVISDHQQSGGSLVSPHYITTTTTHTAASTMVLPLNNTSAVTLGTTQPTHFELNQQPIGFKANVLPQYPPDYSYSSTTQNQQQQRGVVSANETDNSSRFAQELTERKLEQPKPITVEVMRETVVEETIPDERPARPVSRTSEYVTPRSSTIGDEEEHNHVDDSFHTPQNYRITTQRDIGSDEDDDNQQQQYSSAQYARHVQDNSPRTPTNVNTTTNTRYFDVEDSHDDNRTTHRRPVSEFENESQREAYLAHLRHIETEQKAVKQREEEDFTGKRVPELVQRFESYASTNSSAAEAQYYPRHHHRSQTSSSTASPTMQQQQQHQQQRYEHDRESDASLSPVEHRRANILPIERSQSAIAQQQQNHGGPYDKSYVLEEEDEEHEHRVGRGGVVYEDDQERQYGDGRRHL